jgi:hypothetical protein
MTAEEIRKESAHGPRNTSEDWMGHAIWEVAAQLADLNQILRILPGKFSDGDRIRIEELEKPER